ncbi:hypothetical protein V2J09_019305 [Rumex salicifolius]
MQVVDKQDSSLTMWHRRFGHLSYQSLLKLEKEGLVSGLSHLQGSIPVCSTCLGGKQHRHSFPKHSPWRASQKLQLLHADLCGPITPASNNGKLYIFTIIDDFSRKLWVYFLHAKSETLEVFKKFKAQIEKECGLPIVEQMILTVMFPWRILVKLVTAELVTQNQFLKPQN